MVKIKNYILNGRGLGVKVLALFSLFLSLLYLITFNFFYNNVMIDAGGLLERLAPIEIENGTIVAPYNQIIKEKASYFDNKVSYPVVLDTTADEIDLKGLPDGVYISRRYTYLHFANNTQIYAHPEKMTIEKNDYAGWLKNESFSIKSFFGAAILVFCFAFSFVFCLLLAYLSYLVSFIVQKNYVFSQRMRLSTLLYIFVSVLQMFLSFATISVSLPAFVAVICLLQGVFMAKSGDGSSGASSENV